MTMYYIINKNDRVVSGKFDSKSEAEHEAVQLMIKNKCTNYRVKSTEATKIKIYFDENDLNNFQIVISDSKTKAKKKANKITGVKLKFEKGNEYDLIAKIWE